MASAHQAAGPTRRRGPARWQKATALLPLVLLAGAWTANLGSSPSAIADSDDRDPGVPAVPTTSFDQPASYTAPPNIDPDNLGSNPRSWSSSTSVDPSAASADAIPTAAMAAYQRAEAVLNRSDAACNISWALIAGIGRVESDHGRYAGNVLGSDGKSTPGIYGVPLDGRHGTALIRDTDSARYDQDAIFDRAVGPMQFIPSTWDLVGVDGDADGARDPQDIDDAALAAGVYLCAGDQNLATVAGQRSAVFSYNHSDSYVDLVLSIMNAYLSGDYTTVADGLPTYTYVPAVAETAKPGSPRRHRGSQRPTPGEQNPAPGSDDPTPTPGSSTPVPGNSTPEPGEDTPDPGSPDPSPPVERPSPPVEVPVPDPVEPTVERLETLAEATAFCAQKLSGKPGSTPEIIEACGSAVLGKTNEQAARLLTGSLSDVLRRLGLGDLLPDLPTPELPTPSLPGLPLD